LFSHGTRCAGEVMSAVSCVVCCSAMVPGVQARWCRLCPVLYVVQPWYQVCRRGDVGCVLCCMLFSHGTRCAGEVMSAVSCVVCCSVTVPGVQAR